MRIISPPTIPPAAVSNLLAGADVHRGRRAAGEVVWVLDCDLEPWGCHIDAVPTQLPLTCPRCTPEMETQ